jgi:hypothetical protein
MKKLIIPALLIMLFAACSKDHMDEPPAPGNSIIGKWNIITVTVIPLDSTGSAINNGNIYPEPPYYYFQFNANNTWVEDLVSDTSSGLGENGSYLLHGDTSFTLTNVNAPSKAVECHIDSLTNTSFVFSFRRTTLFNGVTPGYLKSVFQLKK